MAKIKKDSKTNNTAKNNAAKKPLNSKIENNNQQNNIQKKTEIDSKNENEKKSIFLKYFIPVIAVLTLAGVGYEIFSVVNVKQEQALQAKQSSEAAASSEAASKLNAKYSKKELNKMELPQLNKNIEKGETKVVMKTTEGDITFKIFDKLAPLAAENFVTHAKEGYYNGVEFFRVMKDFMVQSGDPDNKGTGGTSIWNKKNTKIDAGTGFKNEITPKLYNLLGALSMANTGQENSNGSQFFIVTNTKDATSQITDKKSYPDKILEEYKKGGAPYLDGGYTVFGQVIEGLDVLDKIQNGKVTTSESGEESKPESPVKIESITVE
ncbi:MAG: peptidylprolyl isomerase [Lactobacillaceae bacterium]|nr:peptidylprolyl isomerase [Lactobacillaceae bacterium]